MKASSVHLFKDVIVSCWLPRVPGERPDVALERQVTTNSIIVHVDDCDFEVDYEMSHRIGTAPRDEARLLLASEVARRELKKVGYPNPYARILAAQGKAVHECLPGFDQVEVNHAWAARCKQELDISPNTGISWIRMDTEEIFLEEAQKRARQLIDHNPTNASTFAGTFSIGAAEVTRQEYLEAMKQAEQRYPAGGEVTMDSADEPISDEEFRRRAGFYVGGK